MKEIIMDSTDNMVRACLLEDKRPTEIMVERMDKESRVGNIYAGIVKTIIPSQFAFIDIGESKNAFLYLNDSKEKYLLSPEPEKNTKRLGIKKGDILLVQVSKDETEEKGCCVTTEISFSNHYMVLLKNREHKVGISKKIVNSEEKQRLRDIVESLLPKGYSAIIRTEAENCDSVILGVETEKLVKKVEQIVSKGTYTKAPAKIFSEKNTAVKIVSKLIRSDVEKIIISSREECDGLREYLEDYSKGFSERLEYSKGNLFKKYAIDIKKVLNRKVWLKSGGFIIIEQTEACVVIDVNSGKFIKGKSHEKTAMVTNLEAAGEAARQIRLRNLSGMVLIDFINMYNEESMEKVIGKLKEETAGDRVAVHFAGVIGLGVVLLTRKKTNESLDNVMTDLCPVCAGSGRIFKEGKK